MKFFKRLSSIKHNRERFPVAEIVAVLWVFETALKQSLLFLHLF